MATVDQKYLMFQFAGNINKLMKPVLSSVRKKGHQVMNYLDDFFLVADNFEECKNAVIDTCDLLIKLQFSKHPDKSQFIPVQKMEYLGFTLDSISMTVSLTDVK